MSKSNKESQRLRELEFPLRRFWLGTRTSHFIPSSFWDRVFPSTAQQPSGEVATPRIYHSRALAVIAGAMLLIITVNNVFGLGVVKDRGIRLPRSFNLAVDLMRLDQTWRMYAPTPNIEDGWYTMPAQLKDGSQMDIWLDQPPSLAKPKYVHLNYPDFRAKMLLQRLRLQPKSRIWQDTIRYYIRQWNSRHSEEQHVAKVLVQYVVEQSHNGPVGVRPLVYYDVATETFAPVELPKAPTN